MFRFNSPFMQFATKLCNILYAHILAFACCIPVITAGAGFTALEYVLYRISRDEDGSITKDFFHSFKDNFKHGTVMGIVYFLVASFVMFDIYFLLHQETGMNNIMLIATFAIGILLVLNMTWGFVLLSRYNNSAMKTLKYSFSVCLVYFMPTISMLALVAIPLVLALFSFDIIPYALIFGSVISGYIRPRIYGVIFEKIEAINHESTEDAEEEPALEEES